MNAIEVPYSALTSDVLVALFRLADILQTTPKRAMEIYLANCAEPTPTEEDGQ